MSFVLRWPGGFGTFLAFQASHTRNRRRPPRLQEGPPKMKTRHILPAALFGLLAASGAAQADALANPSMSGPLASNASPTTFDAGPLGNIYVTGAVSGLGIFQSNHTSVPHDNEWIGDFSNAQVEIQKTDGWLQFYAQVGGYSLPALGAPYIRATQQTSNSFGVI